MFLDASTVLYCAYHFKIEFMRCFTPLHYTALQSSYHTYIQHMPPSQQAPAPPKGATAIVHTVLTYLHSHSQSLWHVPVQQSDRTQDNTCRSKKQSSPSFSLGLVLAWLGLASDLPSRRTARLISYGQVFFFFRNMITFFFYPISATASVARYVGWSVPSVGRSVGGAGRRLREEVISQMFVRCSSAG